MLFDKKIKEKESLSAIKDKLLIVDTAFWNGFYKCPDTLQDMQL